MNQLLSLQLWYLFKYVEFTEHFRESDRTLVDEQYLLRYCR